MLWNNLEKKIKMRLSIFELHYSVLQVKVGSHFFLGKETSVDI